MKSAATDKRMAWAIATIAGDSVSASNQDLARLWGERSSRTERFGGPPVSPSRAYSCPGTQHGSIFRSSAGVERQGSLPTPWSIFYWLWRCRSTGSHTRCSVFQTDTPLHLVAISAMDNLPRHHESSMRSSFPTARSCGLHNGSRGPLSAAVSRLSQIGWGLWKSCGNLGCCFASAYC